jgi:hypothetical protein
MAGKPIAVRKTQVFIENEIKQHVTIKIITYFCLITKPEKL